MTTAAYDIAEHLAKLKATDSVRDNHATYGPTLAALGWGYNWDTHEWVHPDGRRGRICYSPTDGRFWLAGPGWTVVEDAQPQ